MQIDWKESIPFVLSDTGKIIEVNILVEVLGYSRYKIYKVSFLKTRTVLMSLLIEIFGNIKGVPKITITDNMKPIVNKPRTRYFKGEVNSQFEEFSKDFGFKVIPCKAKSPQTKDKVESQMKILDEIRAYNGIFITSFMFLLPNDQFLIKDSCSDFVFKLISPLNFLIILLYHKKTTKKRSLLEESLSLRK